MKKFWTWDNAMWCWLVSGALLLLGARLTYLTTYYGYLHRDLSAIMSGGAVALLTSWGAYVFAYMAYLTHTTLSTGKTSTLPPNTKMYSLQEFIEQAKKDLDGYQTDWSGEDTNDWHQAKHTWVDWWRSFSGYYSWEKR